jgi:hypothetical protein
VRRDGVGCEKFMPKVAYYVPAATTVTFEARAHPSSHLCGPSCCASAQFPFVSAVYSGRTTPRVRGQRSGDRMICPA